jgi:23S rRNA (uracil1939-C5)-methyltransferase
VEAFVRSRQRRPQTLIVDPPRTGMSRQALAGAVGLKARTIVYVSCDVATAARDARRFTDAGYSLRRLDAFDLFPNTPHVEIVATFER